MNSSILNLKNNSFKIFLFSYGIILSLMIPLTLYYGGKLMLAILFSPLMFILLLDNFDNYLKPALMTCMFVAFQINLDYRIQLINIFSYVLILYFIINYDKNLFHRYSLPLWVKISSGLFIAAVIISSINSPFVSWLSIYYGLMFFIYIFTGYIVYKTLVTFRDIDEYLKYFIYVCAFYVLFILFSIVSTGILRSNGLNGPTFPDIIVCALLVTIFKYLFFEKGKYIYVGITFVLLIILVTGQSRFAWVGFLSSFLYGLTITILNQRKSVLKRRMVYVLSTILLGIFILLISGLYKIIILRFGDVSLSILQSSDQKELVSNSLDTRALIWLTALNAFLHNQLTGVGYFMFHAVSENYNFLPEPVYQGIVMGLDAHSTLMNFLCETGLIGFASILIFYLVIFTLSFKSIRMARSFSDISRSIVLNILVFFIVTTSIYSGAFTFGYNGYFLYFVFAMVVANYVILKRNLRIDNQVQIY